MAQAIESDTAPRTYRYSAHLTRQTPDGMALVLFNAPATDIGRWAGIPQRLKLNNEETSGFQREVSPTRVRQIAAFFDDSRNIVQNPLLAALQETAAISFDPLEEHPEFGTLSITLEDYGSLSLLDLLRKVAHRLESRVPGLQAEDDRILEIIREASKYHSINGFEDDLTADDEEELSSTDEDVNDAAGAVLGDETQITDFYTEIMGRIIALEKMGSEERPEELLGFTREAMLGYIKPIVLVDGQHRLQGAIRAAENLAKKNRTDGDLFDAVDRGEDPETAAASLLESSVRQLPVSLLMDDSSSEHVFQFIIVNQKATPIGKALLGTIVSTSLSRDELEPVADRLRQANIQLDDSQAVAFLTRFEGSPFRGLVQTGVGRETPNLLIWPVLKGLVGIFRELKGGRLYFSTVDSAAQWRKGQLANCGVVAEGDSDADKFTLWSEPDGPWRDLFITFYIKVRDKLGNVTDPEMSNYWGKTTSQLYNKIYLTILAADFFDYIATKEISFDSIETMETVVDEYLGPLDARYFSRTWKIEGVKKDALATKRKWATLWHDYRKGSSLPTEAAFGRKDV
ncbi:hypothetical protein V7968_02340 [Nocardia vulneris]|uniref:hypothetical protein n=1 Tax=Nocardia vulneris TaxID=1141657 RepID=UPI0030CB5082